MANWNWTRFTPFTDWALLYFSLKSRRCFLWNLSADSASEEVLFKILQPCLQKCYKCLKKIYAMRETDAAIIYTVRTQDTYTILAAFQNIIIPILLNISFKKSLCETSHGKKSRTACVPNRNPPTHLASSLNIIIPLTFQRARLSSPLPPFCKFERGNFLKGGIYGSELASHDW